MGLRVGQGHAQPHQVNDRGSPSSSPRLTARPSSSMCTSAALRCSCRRQVVAAALKGDMRESLNLFKTVFASVT